MKFAELETIPESCKERFLPLSARGCAPLRSIGLTLGGLSDLRRGFIAERPSRRPYSIVIMTIDGEGVFEFEDGSSYRATANDVFISPSGAPGHRHYPFDDWWQIAWFRLADTPYWSFLTDRENTLHRKTRITPAVDAMRHLIQEYLDERSDSVRLMELYSEILLVALRREILPGRSPEKESIRHRLNQLWDDINAHLSRPWSIETMCRISALSRTHLFRNCRELYRTTPADKIRELRLSRAAELLVHFDYSVARVAELVGYKSIYSFSTAFKKRYGASPNRYRVGRVG